jgi:TRAP-type C4-dicarboxylate transport system substrate-binding protein
MLRIITLILAASAVLVTASQAKELRYNLFDVPRSSTFAVIDAFFKDLAATTKGDLTGRIFPGGQLLNLPATLKGVGDGVVDAGFTGTSFNQGELKNTNVLSDLLPFVTNSYVAAAAAAETAILNCEPCLAEFKAAKIVWLGSFGPDPWHMMCREPVTRRSDLEGRKIRVTGASPTRLIRALGGVPVQLRPSEIATALQGGQIDCACGPLTWLDDYKLVDNVKTVIEPAFGVYAGLGAYVFNARTFAAFTPEQRKALMTVIPKSIVSGTKLHLDSALAARKVAREKGVTFWQADADFKAREQEFRKNELANLVSDMRNRGVADPETPIKVHLANIATWEKKFAEMGNDPDKLVEALRSEIFAKSVLAK